MLSDKQFFCLYEIISSTIWRVFQLFTVHRYNSTKSSERWKEWFDSTELATLSEYNCAYSKAEPRNNNPSQKITTIRFASLYVILP